MKTQPINKSIKKIQRHDLKRWSRLMLCVLLGVSLALFPSVGWSQFDVPLLSQGSLNRSKVKPPAINNQGPRQQSTLPSLNLVPNKQIQNRLQNPFTVGAPQFGPSSGASSLANPVPLGLGGNIQNRITRDPVLGGQGRAVTPAAPITQRGNIVEGIIPPTVQPSLGGGGNALGITPRNPNPNMAISGTTQAAETSSTPTTAGSNLSTGKTLLVGQGVTNTSTSEASSLANPVPLGLGGNIQNRVTRDPVLGGLAGTLGTNITGGPDQQGEVTSEVFAPPPALANPGQIGSNLGTLPNANQITTTSGANQNVGTSGTKALGDPVDLGLSGGSQTAIGNRIIPGLNTGGQGQNSGANNTAIQAPQLGGGDVLGGQSGTTTTTTGTTGGQNTTITIEEPQLGGGDVLTGQDGTTTTTVSGEDESVTTTDGTPTDATNTGTSEPNPVATTAGDPGNVEGGGSEGTLALTSQSGQTATTSTTGKSSYQNEEWMRAQQAIQQRQQAIYEAGIQLQFLQGLMQGSGARIKQNLQLQDTYYGMSNRTMNYGAIQNAAEIIQGYLRKNKSPALTDIQPRNGELLLASLILPNVDDAARSLEDQAGEELKDLGNEVDDTASALEDDTDRIKDELENRGENPDGEVETGENDGTGNGEEVEEDKGKKKETWRERRDRQKKERAEKRRQAREQREKELRDSRADLEERNKKFTKDQENLDDKRKDLDKEKEDYNKDLDERRKQNNGRCDRACQEDFEGRKGEIHYKEQGLEREQQDLARQGQEIGNDFNNYERDAFEEESRKDTREYWSNDGEWERHKTRRKAAHEIQKLEQNYDANNLRRGRAELEDGKGKIQDQLNKLDNTGRGDSYEAKNLQRKLKKFDDALDKIKEQENKLQHAKAQVVAEVNQAVADSFGVGKDYRKAREAYEKQARNEIPQREGESNGAYQERTKRMATEFANNGVEFSGEEGRNFSKLHHTIQRTEAIQNASTEELRDAYKVNQQSVKEIEKIQDLVTNGGDIPKDWAEPYVDPIQAQTEALNEKWESVNEGFKEVQKHEQRIADGQQRLKNVGAAEHNSFTFHGSAEEWEEVQQARMEINEARVDLKDAQERYQAEQEALAQESEAIGRAQFVAHGQTSVHPLKQTVASNLKNIREFYGLGPDHKVDQTALKNKAELVAAELEQLDQVEQQLQEQRKNFAQGKVKGSVVDNLVAERSRIKDALEEHGITFENETAENGKIIPGTRKINVVTAANLTTVNLAFDGLAQRGEAGDANQTPLGPDPKGLVAANTGQPVDPQGLNDVANHSNNQMNHSMVSENEDDVEEREGRFNERQVEIRDQARETAKEVARRAGKIVAENIPDNVSQTLNPPVEQQETEVPSATTQGPGLNEQIERLDAQLAALPENNPSVPGLRAHRDALKTHRMDLAKQGLANTIEQLDNQLVGLPDNSPATSAIRHTRDSVKAQLDGLNASTQRDENLQNMRSELDRYKAGHKELLDNLERDAKNMRAQRDQATQERDTAQAEIDAHEKRDWEWGDLIPFGDNPIESQEQTIARANSRINVLSDGINSTEEAINAKKAEFEKFENTRQMEIVRTDPALRKAEEKSRLQELVDLNQEFETKRSQFIAGDKQFKQKLQGLDSAIEQGQANESTWDLAKENLTDTIDQLDNQLAGLPKNSSAASGIRHTRDSFKAQRDVLDIDKLEQNREKVQQTYTEWVEEMQKQLSVRGRDIHRAYDKNRRDGIGPTAAIEVHSQIVAQGGDIKTTLETVDQDRVNATANSSQKVAEGANKNATFEWTGDEVVDTFVDSHPLLSPKKFAGRFGAYTAGVGKGVYEGVKGLAVLGIEGVDLVGEYGEFAVNTYAGTESNIFGRENKDFVANVTEVASELDSKMIYDGTQKVVGMIDRRIEQHAGSGEQGIQNALGDVGMVVGTVATPMPKGLGPLAKVTKAGRARLAARVGGQVSKPLSQTHKGKALISAVGKVGKPVVGTVKAGAAGAARAGKPVVETVKAGARVAGDTVKSGAAGAARAGKPVVETVKAGARLAGDTVKSGAAGAARVGKPVVETVKAGAARVGTATADTARAGATRLLGKEGVRVLGDSLSKTARRAGEYAKAPSHEVPNMLIGDGVRMAGKGLSAAKNKIATRLGKGVENATNVEQATRAGNLGGDTSSVMLAAKARPGSAAAGTAGHTTQRLDDVLSTSPDDIATVIIPRRTTRQTAGTGTQANRPGPAPGTQPFKDVLPTSPDDIITTLNPGRAPHTAAGTGTQANLPRQAGTGTSGAGIASRQGPGGTQRLTSDANPTVPGSHRSPGGDGPGNTQVLSDGEIRKAGNQVMHDKKGMREEVWDLNPGDDVLIPDGLAPPNTGNHIGALAGDSPGTLTRDLSPEGISRLRNTPLNELNELDQARKIDLLRVDRAQKTLTIMMHPVDDVLPLPGAPPKRPAIEPRRIPHEQDAPTGSFDNGGTGVRQDLSDAVVDRSGKPALLDTDTVLDSPNRTGPGGIQRLTSDANPNVPGPSGQIGPQGVGGAKGGGGIRGSAAEQDLVSTRINPGRPPRTIPPTRPLPERGGLGASDEVAQGGGLRAADNAVGGEGVPPPGNPPRQPWSIDLKTPEGRAKAKALERQEVAKAVEPRLNDEIATTLNPGRSAKRPAGTGTQANLPRQAGAGTSGAGTAGRQGPGGTQRLSSHGNQNGGVGSGQGGGPGGPNGTQILPPDDLPPGTQILRPDELPPGTQILRPDELPPGTQILSHNDLPPGTQILKPDELPSGGGITSQSHPQTPGSGPTMSPHNYRGKQLGKGGTSTVFDNLDPNHPETVRRITSLHTEDGIIGAQVDEYGRRFLEKNVGGRPIDTQKIRVVKRKEITHRPNSDPDIEFDEVLEINEKIKTAKELLREQGGRFTEPQIKALREAREEINKSGHVWLDDTTGNYGFDVNETGGLRVVLNDSGGIYPVNGRDPNLAGQIQKMPLETDDSIIKVWENRAKGTKGQVEGWVAEDVINKHGNDLDLKDVAEGLTPKNLPQNPSGLWAHPNVRASLMEPSPSGTPGAGLSKGSSKPVLDSPGSQGPGGSQRVSGDTNSYGSGSPVQASGPKGPNDTHIFPPPDLPPGGPHSFSGDELRPGTQILKSEELPLGGKITSKDQLPATYAIADEWQNRIVPTPRLGPRLPDGDNPATFLRETYGDLGNNPARAYEMASEGLGGQVEGIAGSYVKGRPRFGPWPVSTAKEAALLDKVSIITDPSELQIYPENVRSMIELRTVLGTSKKGLPSDMDIITSSQDMERLTQLKERIFKETGIYVEFVDHVR